ncbi:LysR family transcriptional regulator [Spongiactinospora sp. TRM90649]|uniref:LysR family transcriptional regulator n=1 Tax=Spongiactinospora sp. TRM90649 TaxID=3031114 RepID=UPI0023F6D91B|nr:LysR family transcriptional regulator [Spongiactinospora sp. TRM90649]MDF5752882.1 LysR family transcriptional regulator [Spongiactinospora sp. TRM90649]
MTRMDPAPPLRDLACLASVARHLGFSRAAAELSMSQPAVSQAIGRLERGLGLRLFERTSREVRLTAAGAALLPYAEALLDDAAAFSAEAGRLAAQATPAIRFAYPSLLGGLAAQVARRMARRSPPIEVELRPAGWAAATAALSSGEVAAALLGAPFPREFTTAARFHVPVDHIAVPAGDPLARSSGLRPDRLGRHRVLLPGNRPPGGMWARFAARLRGPQRVVGGDLDDLAAALDLVAAGMGLLPVPNLLVRSVRRHDVEFVPFDGGGLRLAYAVAWPPDRVSPELMAVVRTVQEALWTR